MSDKLAKKVKEWLSEYKALPECELRNYASTIRDNDELIESLYDVFDDDSLPSEVVDPVCHQLFDFYRSRLRELQCFTLELLPVLISTYLVAQTRNNKKKDGGIEACLLAIYNLDIVDEDGKPKVKTVSIPTLAVRSVYHEPPSLATIALTESALLRYHSDEPIVTTIGPLPQIHQVNVQNRLLILKHLIGRYCMDIANLSPRSRQTLCKVASKVVTSGFENLGDMECISRSLNDSSSSSSGAAFRRGVHFRTEPRIPLSSGFLVELLSVVYFALFNGQAREAMQALEDIHHRAEYEMYSDVLLVTNAIRHSLSANQSVQPEDGPLGITSNLSTYQQSMAALYKDVITNASFRAKKLPDDLEVSDESMSPEQSPITTKQPLHVSPKASYKAKNGNKAEAHKRSSGKRKLSRRSESVTSTTGSAEDHSACSRIQQAATTKEDIEVPEDEQETGPDLPPLYDEVLEQDRQKLDKSFGKASKKPLKTIMKKAEKIRVQRKESDPRRTKDVIDSHSPKSPKHSLSVSSGLYSSHNGSLGEQSQMHLQVDHSTTNTLSEETEMQTAPTNHRRTTSNPERIAPTDDSSDRQGAPLESMSQDLRPVIQGEDTVSESGSVNTPM